MRRALALVLLIVACSRRVSAPPAPAVTAGALELPEVAGFAAAAPDRGSGFVRRTYTRGPARVQVTLARMPMADDDYARWCAASAGFPQADLSVPATAANGFYQCTDGDRPSCDLLIQLRAGFHLEVRGGGTTTRADVDALARGLPLRAWAGP